MEFMSLNPYTITAVGLILIGMYAILVKRNLIKIVIGITLMDSGVNLLLVTLGYIHGRTAPIFTDVGPAGNVVGPAASTMVDPLPQALVLTAIVIGLGVTSVALAIVIRLYNQHETLNIDNIRKLKW